MRMIRDLELKLIQGIHRESLRSANRRFGRALHACESVQAGRLDALIKANATTAYGRAYGFPSISSLREWQDRVPIVGYDDLQPWVQRAAAGEPGVLTSEPIRIFERTGGSTSANKWVPCTASLFREFAAATGPWLFGLYTAFPELRGTTSYWSISPATRQAELTEGGIPVGFEDDTDYFGVAERFALRRMMAVPAEVARIKDMEAWAEATVRHLVAAADLGLISVWHPSFFVLLLKRIEANLDALLDTVPPRHAAAVRARLRDGTLGEALWPKLAVVSCWADGAAAAAIPELAKYLPQAHLQPKGLLATEGVISFPVPSFNRRDGCKSVAAVGGHFLEFLDLESPSARPLLAHQLQREGAYAPLLTTGGGFYRYRLGDAVRCTGFLGQVPVLRFEGRIDQVSDLCGEKLNPHMAAAALARVELSRGRTFEFAMLSPATGDPPYYRLYVEGEDSRDPEKLADVCQVLEVALGESHGYRYARNLGQLGPVRGLPVENGAERYLRARMAAGQRAGDIKPSHLDGSLDWSRIFGDGSEMPVEMKR